MCSGCNIDFVSVSLSGRRKILRCKFPDDAEILRIPFPEAYRECKESFPKRSRVKIRGTVAQRKICHFLPVFAMPFNVWESSCTRSTCVHVTRRVQS